MEKETISKGQAISLAALFVMGSTITLGTAGQAKNDLWISIIIAFAASIPFILIYTRILSMFPGKDLFEILETVFGKLAGKLLTIIYIWYAFHLGSLVIRNFAEFVNTVSLPETPLFITVFFFGIFGIWIVKAGIEVFGRTANLFIMIDLIVILLVNLAVFPQINPDFLKPVLGNGWAPVLQGAFSSFTFPFAETVVLMGAIFSLNKKDSLAKSYLWGLGIAAAIILILGVRNVLMLGANYVTSLYFPSYIAVSRIKIGEFLQRIEVTVDIVFLSTAFFKSSLCLLTACRGIKSLFNLSDYRSVVLQTGLLMSTFSCLVYKSIMEMREWAFEIYQYYALPFQVFLPAIILVGATIRKRRGKEPEEKCTTV
ncbi:MAG: endospore germination permease [Clostridia bacterium]|nr:endospore germination permease [Clostridia bacterium]